MAHLTRCEREREHCGDGDDAHYYDVIGLLVGDVSWAIEPAAARARLELQVQVRVQVESPAGQFCISQSTAAIHIMWNPSNMLDLYIEIA